MAKFARLSDGVKKHDILQISRPFSNFDFIEDNYGDFLPLRRIFSQVRQHDGKILIKEIINESEDIHQENEDLNSIYPDFSSSSSELHRLSFFKKKINSHESISSLSNEDFIGYAIIKLDSSKHYNNTRIYESVMRSSAHENNFIKGEQNWHCKVYDKEFDIRGYLYAQQNGETCKCAHVALRTAAARFHKDSDMTYREMNVLSKEFRRKNGITDRPKNTLYVQEIIYILKNIGASYFCGNYHELNSLSVEPFQKYIYGSIEYGYPAIVVFKTLRPGDLHAIPVFGHTFNEDTWAQRAESSYFTIGKETTYLPSESWVSMYIAHDDNWGSNYCIPRHYLYTQKVCDELEPDPVFCEIEEECVSYVIGTMPKEVKVDPIDAEAIGIDYFKMILPKLSGKHKWAKRLKYIYKCNQLVLRPVLISTNEYLDHLQEIRGWEPSEKIDDDWFVILPNLFQKLKKQRLWMIELSIPDLFSTNQRKVGEVILNAEVKAKEERDFANFLLARLPGDFYFYQKSTGKPDFALFPSGIRSHVMLYGCKE